MDVTLLRHPLTPLLKLPNTSEYAATFLPWSPYSRSPYDGALKLKAVHVVTPLRGQTLASLAFAISSSPLESVGGDLQRFWPCLSHPARCLCYTDAALEICR